MVKVRQLKTSFVQNEKTFRFLVRTLEIVNIGILAVVTNGF